MGRFLGGVKDFLGVGVEIVFGAQRRRRGRFFKRVMSKIAMRETTKENAEELVQYFC